MKNSAKPVVKTPQRSLHFSQRRDFQKTLNERVQVYMRENHLPARDLPAMFIKTAVMLVWWLAIYLLLLLGHFSAPLNLVLCLVWGFSIAGIGFNVMHDANHGGYSDRPLVNRLVSLSAEMLGMSGFRWRTKHNVWHHTYTNVAGFDDDLETFGTMRLSPRLPWKPLHRAQTWYYPLVYSFIGFDFILRDFMMVLFGKSDENHVYPKMTVPDQLVFWLGKLFFILIMFVIPLQVFPWWQILVGFVLALMSAGVVMGIVFQLAHINGDAAFPQPAGKSLRIENEWAIHQIETTTDFAPRNRVLSYYIGGLNFQIEHHLFPHVCHLNYPILAPIVQATCAEFGVRYTSYPTWREAFARHLRQLRLLGSAPDAPG